MLRSSECWWLWKQPVMGWHGWLWKEPVVMCSNWNVRQAMSQQLFRMTTFCTDTRFQSFLPLINCIVHHAVLKFSACFNKTLPQLVRGADWYYDTRALAAYPRHGNLPGWGQEWTVDWPHYQDWWTGLSHGAEARLCHKHDVLAHCLAGRQIRLQQCCRSLVFCISNTPR